MPNIQLLVAYIDPTGGLPPSMWGAILATVLAAIGATIAWLKVFGRVWLAMLVAHRGTASLVAGALVIAGLCMGILWFRGDADSSSDASDTAPSSTGKGELPRVLVLAFDGLDPRLLDEYMKQGRLPNFSRLAKDGIYHPLATSMPPQSPVAWCTFITGEDPGQHGVFDFIKRRPDKYLPDLSLADRQKMTLPWKGTGLWERPAVRQLGTVAQRLPMVFPPPKLKGRMLAGMGVWDVRGTEGTYFYYTTAADDGRELRGMRFQFSREGDLLRGELPGPYRAGGSDNVREPFELKLAGDQATLSLQGQDYTLKPGRWSDWIDVEFGLGPLGMQKVRAVTRVLLRTDGGSNHDEVSLYVSPLNFDPRSPMYPISSPRGYAADLAEAIGLYATRGMPFDTQAVNDGVLSDTDFLAQVESVTAESEQMLIHELAKFKSGVLFAYFEASDVVQHMFWRGIDPEHPLYRDKETAEHRDAIPKFYEQCDAILGRARAALGASGQIVVMSDHGFGPYRQSVHLNTVLRELGFLQLRDDVPSGGELLKGIDWSRTKAYALGFNAVYLNLAGREGLGIVKPEEADSLARTIAAALERWKDPETGMVPVKKAYLGSEIYRAGDTTNRPDLVVGYARGYRASWETALGATPARSTEPNRKKWSGDHCIDAAEVPGIFLSSDKSLDAESLAGMAGMLDDYLAAKLSADKPAKP